MQRSASDCRQPLVFVLPLLAALTGAAQAGFYKCTDAAGEISYQQTACAGDASGESLRLPGTVQEAAPVGSNPGAGTDRARSRGSAKHWSVEQQLKRMQAPSAQGAQTSTKPAQKGRAESLARPRRLEILNAIRRRQVIPGMTPDEVEDALGPPSASKRDGEGLRSWSYRGTDADDNRRSQTVYFRDGHVTGVSSSGTRAKDRFDPDQDRWLE